MNQLDNSDWQLKVGILMPGVEFLLTGLWVFGRNIISLDGEIWIRWYMHIYTQIYIYCMYLFNAYVTVTMAYWLGWLSCDASPPTGIYTYFYLLNSGITITYHRTKSFLKNMWYQTYVFMLLVQQLLTELYFKQAWNIGTMMLIRCLTSYWSPLDLGQCLPYSSCLNLTKL